MLMKTLEFLGIITVPITLNPQVRLQELMGKKKKKTCIQEEQELIT